MRSSFLLVGAASISISSLVPSIAAAPLLSSLLTGILPNSPDSHSYSSKHVSNVSPNYMRSSSDEGMLISGMSSDTLLQSLRILPDDDNDGLLDLEAKLKVLKDGALLDLGGVVQIGGLLDACVDVVVDGKTTQHCSPSTRHRGHGKFKGLSKHRDNWSKEEHRRCSAHFKQWHHSHGTDSANTCSAKLEQALKKIRDLENQLDKCSGNKDFNPGNIKTVALQNSSSDDDGNDKTESGSRSDSNESSSTKHHHSHSDGTPTAGSHASWSNGSKSGHEISNDCNGVVEDKVDENGIHVKVCIAAGVDVAGVKASAKVDAHADVDLNKGQVDAAASDSITANVLGVASASAQATATASIDLKKGTADVKINSNDALGLGGNKIIDTGVNAEVAVNKKCEDGSILNVAGICVALNSDNSKDGPWEQNGSLLGLTNALGGSRSL